MGLRDDILATTLAKKKIEVPGWPGIECYVREITAGELGQANQESVSLGPDGTLIVNPDISGKRQRLVMRCLVDADGQRVFADTDFEAVSALSGAAIDFLYDAAREINAANVANVEQLEKNSEPGRSG